MKTPHKVLVVSVAISLIALCATSYFYVQASKNHERTMAYLNALQEKEEWTKAREALQENNRKLRAALQSKGIRKRESRLQIVPEELVSVEETLTIPAEIMEVRPFHLKDKSCRLLSRSRVDILEENIKRLKKSQRQNIALDRIEKHIRKIEYNMHLLNPASRYRWTYDEEMP